MRKLDAQILLSATDLMRFMGCRHATVLDMDYLAGKGPKPREETDDARLLQAKGNEHEATHLARLKAEGITVIEIPRDELARNVEVTREALEQGADVIFQGAFLNGNWGGWSDFLEKVDKPSRLGPFSYEVTDTKLKRRPHPKHVLQLVLYSDLLTEVQGARPDFAHVELGNGERATLRLVEYAAYARLARERLEAFIAEPQPTRPIPCADCGLCRWADHCGSVWAAEDSLFNIANISRTQVKKLEKENIRTLEQLAGSTGRVRGIATETLQKLRSQARLQQARKTGAPTFELRPPLPGKGFELLPQPKPGDLFYDIEGDPHYEDGLEYLHGVWADGKFQALWAHDHGQEAAILRKLLDLFSSQIERHPDARIYHYAPYEVTALRRLTSRYGIGEAFLDRLLRERRFVDLYAVVRGAIITSEPNYSIKSLEIFYGLIRQGDVTNAGASVIAYENWRETGQQSILDEIEEYNRIDCISTEKLRNWLVSIRPAGAWPAFDYDASETEAEEEADETMLRERIAASGLPEDRKQLLFDLGMFHKREKKPAWWALFDSLSKEEDELIDDLDAIGGLEATGPAFVVKRSVGRTYRFPPQETKLRDGKSATIATPDGFQQVTVVDFDRAALTATLKIGKDKSDLLTDRLSLHPDKPLGTEVIAAAIRDVIADQCGVKNYTAAADLVARQPPRLEGRPSRDVLDGNDPLAGTVAAVSRMQGTVLPIQGPPGTGKTYVTARAILSLVRDGNRVGVASNSHEAIRNVLLGCLSAQPEVKLPTSSVIVHKVSPGEDGYPEGIAGITRVTSNTDPSLENADIIGGTAFFFARDTNIQAFDWLFVDEAGQVSLANMLAMARAARNIVLVGDPRQLPQVIQGSHPYPANLSCLEWLLGEHATVPPDRGIFLPVTRRMHSDVCRFISEQVYEGRLESAPGTERQAVSSTMFPKAGAYWVSVPHDGNAQVSSEEVAAIAAAVENLLAGTWTDSTGVSRPVEKGDLIVVAPYNAQVNALRDVLPSDVRVGTVDKFQGQEAPICLVSMTASSAEETQRGMEFLFSLNRINVAVSRAKALALVFGSPRLREAKCETVEQMRLVNTLCALPELKV